MPSRAPARPMTRQRVTAAAPVMIDLHPPAARRVASSEGQVDHAFIFAGAARDHRPISLRDLAGLEEAAQLLESRTVAAENQASRGIAIETMGELGPAREAEAQAVEERGERHASLAIALVSVLGSGMHRQAGRLVDDDRQGVPVEDAADQLFRCHARGGIGNR